MKRVLGRLTAPECKNAPAGKLFDGGNLVLVKRSKESGKWVLRYTWGGRRKDMGLGGWPAVSLAIAREQARIARDDLGSGNDPIRERRRREKSKLAGTMTFADCAKQKFESAKPTLKDADRWWSSVKIHALPILGQLPVADVDQHDVVDALRPIWRTKYPTAEKVAGRINLIIEYGAALGLDTDIMAVGKAHLILGKPDHKVEHIVATPWKQLPTLYSRINTKDHGVPGLLLRMLILTAGTRTAEVRRARWENFDVETASLIVPPADNKLSDMRRVPLSTHAVQLLEEVKPFAENGWIFPSQRGTAGQMNAANNILNKLKEAGRGHGFRTSFKQWSLAKGHAVGGIDELCLDHRPDRKVVQAYARTHGADAIADNTDLLEQRRALWQKWGDHATGQAAQIVPIGARHGAAA